MKATQPLGFHRVMERNPIAASNSPLFKCPPEILLEIVDYLGANAADLATLAFVNSDCRQLARSWQFRKITLDSNPRGRAILDVLLSEAHLRQQNKLGLSLGACIRHIKTSNNGYWERAMAMRPRNPGFSTDDIEEEAMDQDEAKLDQWRSELSVLRDETDDFFRTAHYAMTSLPHLYTLELTEGGTVDQSFIDWLLSFTTVRHLKKARLQMTGEIPRIPGSVEWPLEILEIDLDWDFQYGYERKDLDASKHWYLLLRPCAPTLQSLKLSYRRLFGAINEKPVSFDLQFPQLRHLQLDYAGNEDFEASTLRSLITTSNWLSSLSIDFGNRQIRQILQNSGRVPTLKTLILNNTLAYKPEAEQNKCTSLSFLEDNPQLTSFTIKKPTKPYLLERALSRLRRSQLTKLSMTWKGKEDTGTNDTSLVQPSFSEIPETSLRALANMVFLEDLHLDCISTVRMNVYMRDWFVNHNVLREHLGPTLCKLKRLALTRDIYGYEGPKILPGLPADFVYEFQTYTELRSRDDWWEMHVSHMREQAVLYAEKFPRLEFLHIGEVSFGITRDKDLQVVVLDESESQALSWVVGWHSD